MVKFKDITQDIKDLTQVVKKLRLLVKGSPQDYDLDKQLKDAERHLRRLMRTDGIRQAHETTLDRTNRVKLED